MFRNKHSHFSGILETGKTELTPEYMDESPLLLTVLAIESRLHQKLGSYAEWDVTDSYSVSSCS